MRGQPQREKLYLRTYVPNKDSNATSEDSDHCANSQADLNLRWAHMQGARDRRYVFWYCGSGLILFSFRIKRQSGVDFPDMLYFDDEKEHLSEVAGTCTGKWIGKYMKYINLNSLCSFPCSRVQFCTLWSACICCIASWYRWLSITDNIKITRCTHFYCTQLWLLVYMDSSLIFDINFHLDSFSMHSTSRKRHLKTSIMSFESRY